MKIRIQKTFFLIIGATFVLTMGCGDEKKKQSESVAKLSHRIVTTAYPIQFLTQRLVGGAIAVECPAAETANPRIWEPGPADIESMQEADLIITGGPALPYAEWLAKVSLPESKIANCSKAMKIAEFVHIEDYRVTHQHGPGGEHSHALLIPYAWLDPGMAKKLALYIAKRLTNVYPELSQTIDANLKTLSNELDELSSELGSIKPVEQQLLFSSPNFSFLARALGADNNYLLWVEPSIDEDEEAIRVTQASEIENLETKIFVGNDFAQATMETVLREKPFATVHFNTLDHKPRQGDYLSEMTTFAARLKKALK